MFSHNVETSLREELSSVLNVQVTLGGGKYLGFPCMIGRNKREVFNYLKDRIWKKISSWKGKSLSMVGREVLIKSVAQAIPSYCMSMYLIPDSLGDEIEKMLNFFWWGKRSGANRGITWLSWEKLCMPKDKGGLSFRNMFAFNLAMLGKQAWKLMSQPEALVSRLFKAKYFPSSDFMEVKVGHNPSYAWRSICEARVLVKEGSRWCIGKGENIPVCDGRWMRNNSGSALNSELTFACRYLVDNQHLFADLKVQDLLLHDRKEWNTNLIASLFPEAVSKVITCSPLIDSVKEDRLIWAPSKDGRYVVKSAYRMAITQLVDSSHLVVDGKWSQIWKIQAPQRIKLFLWRVCRQCVPTRWRLQQKHIPCPPECILCDSSVEDLWHIFLECPISIECWRQLAMWDRISNIKQNVQSMTEFCFAYLSSLDENGRAIFAVMLWALWRHRNEKLWQGTNSGANQIISRATCFLTSWKQVHGMLTNSIFMPSHDPVVHRWNTPPPGSIKINVDAGFFMEQRTTSFAMCARNEFGSFVMARTEWLRQFLPTLEGEAMGLLKALRWAQSLDLTNVIFELDCKCVVDSINNQREDVSELGDIIRDYKTILSVCPSFSVSFVRRQANSVAHALAKATSLMASPQNYNYVPLCISAFIINEMP